MLHRVSDCHKHHKRSGSLSDGFIGYMPLPNAANGPTSNINNNFVSQSERQDKFPVVSVRADQNWTNSHHSFVTARWSHLWETAGFTFGLNNVLAGGHLQRIAENIGLDHV